jgi:hypothetical protein
MGSQDTAVSPPLLTVMLQRRLRMPVFTELFHCPFCDGVMDTFGDHALACSGGGDRTIRHNRLRDTVFRVAHAAGLRPEIEKPGLLRPRLLIGITEEDGKCRGGSRGPEGRRPADVYLPAWRLGKPAAIDLAVTSGLGLGLTSLSAENGSHAATVYAARKRSFLDTESHCREVGIDFVPAIIEAAGGSWGPDARSLLKDISKVAARLTGDQPAIKLEQSLQLLSVILHSTNARAILRRAPPVPPANSARVVAQAALVRAEAERTGDDMRIDD